MSIFEHVTDLLPSYLNGRLEATQQDYVRVHLLHCETCKQELAAWQSVQTIANEAYTAMPMPSVQVLDNVWARLDVPVAEKQVQTNWQFWPKLARLWLLLRLQIPLLHKSIWIGSVLVCVLGFILSTLVMTAGRSLAQMQFSANLLVLFIIMAGASGSAFISGASVDPNYELALSTPTSVRILMLFRMLLVLGYNFLLATLASAVFALLYGGSLWGFVQLWLGPMCFFASLCLAITLLAGSTFGLICTIVMEFLQTFPKFELMRLVNLHILPLDLHPTSPVFLVATMLLLAFAILYVPRQPRFESLA